LAVLIREAPLFEWCDSGGLLRWNGNRFFAV